MLSPFLLAGALLGWALGGNNACDIFGTAVGTRVIKFRTAVILLAIFVVIGSLLDGAHGVHKLSDYAFNGGINKPILAFLVMLAAGATVTAMTLVKMPVSATQAVMGAIIGAGACFGKADLKATLPFLGAWLATPIGAMIISFLLLKIFEKFIEKHIKNIIIYDRVVKVGYYAAGIFGAYSLGANNVANVASIFAGKLSLVTTQQAVLIGGLSMGLGALTFSKRTMATVGEHIVSLTSISGFLSIIAAFSIVYLYARIGIPVSTTQAVVGAVIGIGLTKGVNAINMKVIKNILFAWFGTPTVAGILSVIFIYVYRMFL